MKKLQIYIDDKLISTLDFSNVNAKETDIHIVENISSNALKITTYFWKELPLDEVEKG